MSPPVPAATMAPFEFTIPFSAFSSDTGGRTCPVAQAVKYPSGPEGATVTLNEYAAAVGGTPQPSAVTGNDRLVPPGSDGPPNEPVAPRVSINRQGVSG